MILESLVFDLSDCKKIEKGKALKYVVCTPLLI